jgi:hypothetical protein
VDAGEDEWCAAFTVMTTATCLRLVDALAACSGTDLEAPTAAMLETVLTMTASATELAVAEETLSLWDELSGRVCASRTQGHWVGLFSRVVHALLARCQYEPDFDEWGTAVMDEGSFRRFRRSAGAALRASAAVLGGDTLAAITAPLSSDAEGGGGATWQAFEAAFFAATAVATEVLPRGSARGGGGFGGAAVRSGGGGGGRAADGGGATSERLSVEAQAALLSFVEVGFGQNAAELHPLVRCSALQFAGAFAQWVGEDASRLARVVEVTVGNMENDAVVDVAADAFRQLCAACGRQLAAQADVGGLVAQVAR